MAVYELEKLSTDYTTYSDNTTKQDEILLLAKNTHTKKITEYLDALKNLFSLSCFTSNTSLETSRATIAASRTGWSTLSSDLSLKMNLIKSAETTFSQSRNDLYISQSGEKTESKPAIC